MVFTGARAGGFARNCKFAAMKPDLQRVLFCANEIQNATDALSESNAHPISFLVWQLDWVCELRAEVGR